MLTRAPAQGGNKAAAGGDQIGSKKGKDADGDASIPLKAVAEGIVTPVTTTDVDSSGTHAFTSRLHHVLAMQEAFRTGLSECHPDGHPLLRASLCQVAVPWQRRLANQHTHCGTSWHLVQIKAAL